MSIIKEEKRVKGKQSKYVNSLVKEFDKADAIRNELLEKGIELLDTREGTKYKRA